MGLVSTDRWSVCALNYKFVANFVYGMCVNQMLRKEVTGKAEKSMETASVLKVFK